MFPFLDLELGFLVCMLYCDHRKYVKPSELVFFKELFAYITSSDVNNM